MQRMHSLNCKVFIRLLSQYHQMSIRLCSPCRIRMLGSARAQCAGVSAQWQQHSSARFLFMSKHALANFLHTSCHEHPSLNCRLQSHPRLLNVRCCNQEGCTKVVFMHWKSP